jgi:hypothetical protein
MWLIKYVAPVYLLTIFVIWLQQNLGGYVKALTENNVVLMSVVLVILVLVFFLLLVAQSVRRWRKAEREAGEAGP